ncbi:MAG TPA: hypothetical protein VMA53_16905 [Stellaceae bacterium]|nr:hypothetical protein [Stellaceae bacterium]
MSRLASPLLAAAVLAASAGMAFAANAPAAAQPPAAAHHPRPIESRAFGDRMTAALNLLEAKGYGAFSDFKQNGNDFAATVTENGQHFAVTVDPDSGQVTRQG